MFVSLDTDVFDVRKNGTPEIVDRSILTIDRWDDSWHVSSNEYSNEFTSKSR